MMSLINPQKRAINEVALPDLNCQIFLRDSGHGCDSKLADYVTTRRMETPAPVTSCLTQQVLCKVEGVFKVPPAAPMGRKLKLTLTAKRPKRGECDWTKGRQLVRSSPSHSYQSDSDQCNLHGGYSPICNSSNSSAVNTRERV